MTDFISDIYEVSVGADPKNSMRYTVGRVYNLDLTVCEIVFDRNYLIEYGSVRVIVYAADKKGSIRVWKDMIGVPVIITPNYKEDGNPSKNPH